jgi:monofunctional biosynthetic peptidoglycan transglycosylase
MSSLHNSDPAPARPAKVIPLRPGTKIRRHPIRRAFKFVFRLVVSLIVLSLLATVSLNWWTPPRTAFMLEAGEPIVYQYVSMDHISRFVVAAALVHEDDQLGTRYGAFDWDAFWARAQAYNAGQPDPSGSTIPQQLVKNIYLWPSQDFLRKGIEAGLAEEVDVFVPKQRIMELYLNYAQFGPKLFGICAATWYYFDTPPSALTEYQADQLMGVLPLPDKVKRAPGGGIDLGPSADAQAVNLVNGAANVWLPRQLNNMGGWQRAVATIGITDTATDHSSTLDSPDGCGTMPHAVTDRLKAEGALK